MRLLRTLTLGYVVVLVLALAASLIAILAYLIRIGSALADVRQSLEQVSVNTAPLEEPLRGLQDVTARWSAGLARVRGNLQRADALLGRLADHLLGSAAR